MNNNSYWDMIFKEKYNEVPVRSLWLDKYIDLFEEQKHFKIIDLGCGDGADVLYLKGLGYHVIACDYSDEALKIVRKNNPSIETVNYDLSEKFEFKNEYFGIVIANLSIHYFDKNQTRNIIHEIKRILKKNGYFICRVNSINDVNFSALEGEEIDYHFYYNNNQYKRFFDRADIDYFFGVDELMYCEEVKEYKYGKMKIIWEILIKKYD